MKKKLLNAQKVKFVEISVAFITGKPVLEPETAESGHHFRRRLMRKTSRMGKFTLIPNGIVREPISNRYSISLQVSL